MRKAALSYFLPFGNSVVLPVTVETGKRPTDTRHCLMNLFDLSSVMIGHAGVLFPYFRDIAFLAK